MILLFFTLTMNEWSIFEDLLLGTYVFVLLCTVHLNAPRDIVAQWLTQWSYMREVPGSIPIHATCLFYHFISYGEVANSSFFARI